MSLRISLLAVGDGPEGISIYTDDDRGVVDWSQTYPAVYVHVAINGASAHFGPFTLESIYNQLKERLK
jgi:hypothetical protein